MGASVQLRVLAEKGDDHFYGAWKGGGKSAGGGPADSPEGRAIEGADRWADHGALVKEMESKYPGSKWGDLQKLDIHTASLAADQIDTTVGRFGGIPNFQGVRVPEHSKGGVIAEVKRVDPSKPGSAVYLYPGYWKGDGLAKLYAGSKNANNFTSNGLGSKEAMARSIITHELGHQYMGLNLHSRLGADRNAAVRKELEPWFHNTFLPNMKTAHVSRYARRNPHEAWAELFAAATGAGQSKSHFVPELKAILDKHYPAAVQEGASLLSGFESAGKRDINLHAIAEAAAKNDPALEPHCGWAIAHPEIGVQEEANVDVPVEERDFSAKRREALAAKGAAMEDGSFPIVNASDLANAVQAIGRAKDYDAAKAHIIKRARALGLTGSLPSEWGIKEATMNLYERDIALLSEKGSDHFYGAWKGGDGGGPAGLPGIEHTDGVTKLDDVSGFTPIEMTAKNAPDTGDRVEMVVRTGPPTKPGLLGRARGEKEKQPGLSIRGIVALGPADTDWRGNESFDRTGLIHFVGDRAVRASDVIAFKVTSRAPRDAKGQVIPQRMTNERRAELTKAMKDVKEAVEVPALTAQDLLLLEAMGEPVPFASRGTEASSAQFRILFEKSKDDHYYGAWRGGPRSAGGGPAPEGPTQDDEAVRAVARSIHAKAAKEEPSITEHVVDIGTQVNGDPDYGGALAHRLKTEGSLSRKIAADAREQGISPKKAGEGVKDAIRYTYVVREKDYTSAYDKARAALESRGYSHVRSKNFWGEPPPQYQGVNSVFKTPKGSYMELQFHTAASLKAKNLNHSIKEKWDAAPPGPYRDRLYARMAANEAKVPKPPNVYSVGTATTR